MKKLFALIGLVVSGLVSAQIPYNSFPPAPPLNGQEKVLVNIGPDALYLTTTGAIAGLGGGGGGGSVNFSSPDGSLTITGSGTNNITAVVAEINPALITGGIIPFTVLPTLTGNTAIAASCVSNVTPSGTAFIDNINVPNGATVFLGKQTNGAQNGPWIVNTSGGWPRPPWYPSGSTTAAVIGMTITVAPGTSTSICGGQTYQLLFANGVQANPITIDSSTTSWFQTDNFALPSNGALVNRSTNIHWGDTSNVLDFAKPWSGAIRRQYGNSAPSGIVCTTGSTSITLSSVTVPANYNGATVALPGCGNPGAIDSSNPGASTGTFSFTTPGTGYYPQQYIDVAGGTSTTTARGIIYSTVVSALPTITSAGSGCTNGTQTLTGTTGVAGSTSTNFFTVNATVAGNVVTVINSFSANGPYTQNPINLAAEPVSGGGCTVKPTLGLAMGASLASMTIAGNYTGVPANPVSFTPSSLPLASLTWAASVVTATIQSNAVGSALVLPGWMFPGWTSGLTTFPVTIAGATPFGYNGTYTATVTGPTTFTFPLVSNPGTETVAGTYQVAPAATGATVTFGSSPFWYGNPLVGTISNISSGSFTISNAAQSTQTAGLGTVYMWLGNDNTAFANAFTNATSTAPAKIVLPNPPSVPGWESGYMLSAGQTLSAPGKRDFDCQGNWISGAAAILSPSGNAMLTISSASAFRDTAGSIVQNCEFDAAGGFARDFTMADWDWIVDSNVFKNANTINIAWSYGGHSRESVISHFMVLNDGYNPLTFPIQGLDSEADDTRVEHALIMQGFQNAAINSGPGVGDVHYEDIHAETTLAGPIFAEFGAGNWWVDDIGDSPPPGFAGFIGFSGFNVYEVDNYQAAGGWKGQSGILFPPASQHNQVISGVLTGGSTPAAFGCVDLTTNGNNNWYPLPSACATTAANVVAYPKLNGTLPSLVAGTNVTITGTFPNQIVNASSTAGTAFSALTGSTNTTAAMVVGTGASLTVSGTGVINADQVNGATVPTSAALLSSNGTGQLTSVTTPLALSLGGTGANSLAGANIAVFTGTITPGDCTSWSTSTVIQDAGAPCGSGGGSSAFNAITTGTNTTAAMTVGTGGSLTFSGSGVVNADQVNGAAVPTSAAVTATNASKQLTALTLGGNLSIISSVFQTSQAINAQTGTTYTVVAGDEGKLITTCNSGAIAVSLPQAGTTGFTAGFSIDVENLCAGTVTITPTTSTVNGFATLTILQNLGCTLTSDGTNYQVSACTAEIPNSYTVSGLPTCSANANKFRTLIATDITTLTYNATPTGGGSIISPVFCNGTAWTSH